MEGTRSGSRFGFANLRRVQEIVACSRETAQWIPVTLDYLGLHSIRYPYELRLRSGERIMLREHTDVVVFWMVFARKHYQVAESHRVIMDIGANIGTFTLYAARKAPTARIIAVEPFPDTRERLAQLVEENHLRDRVTILDCAIASSAGEGQMDSADVIPSQYRRIFSPETKTLNALHRKVSSENQESGGVPVRTETLAEVLNAVGVDVVDMVKMNIHGSEYEVLMSTHPKVLQRCRQIAVQYHELPAEMRMGKQQIFDHLKELGFSLVADNDTHRGSGLAVFAGSC